MSPLPRTSRLRMRDETCRLRNTCPSLTSSMARITSSVGFVFMTYPEAPASTARSAYKSSLYFEKTRMRTSGTLERIFWMSVSPSASPSEISTTTTSGSRCSTRVRASSEFADSASSSISGRPSIRDRRTSRMAGCLSTTTICVLSRTASELIRLELRWLVVWRSQVGTDASMAPSRVTARAGRAERPARRIGERRDVRRCRSLSRAFP